MNIKAWFSDKKAGFFVTLAGIALTLVLAIIYVACNGGGDGTSDNMSWPAFILLLAGVVAAVVLVALRQQRYAGIALTVCTLISLGLYIYAIYLYVSAAFVGIDSTWSASFFAITIFYVLALAADIAALCLSLELSAPRRAGKKALVSATAVMLTVFISGTIIANENPAQINSALGITTSYFEGEGEDYYKSSYENLETLIADGRALGEEVMEEGIVLLRNEKVDGNPALPLESARATSLSSA